MATAKPRVLPAISAASPVSGLLLPVLPVVVG